MKKLTVDEIIGGLVDAYEKLLILTTDSKLTADYHNMLGQVTALRWVLGQYKCSLDGTFNETMTDDDENRHTHRTDDEEYS